MIIKSFQFKFKELTDKKFFLFYGNNQGLIEQTIKENFNSVFKDQIFKYDENEIIKNSENFNNEILSKSFFESKKLIIIQRITDKIFNTIEDIINKDIEDITILLISETLEKKSKLRKLFEKQNSIICVPFYEDNVQSLNLMASSFLKEKKISLSQQNINLIVNRSRGDRINLLNELQKIENFSKNKKQINIDEIYKLTNLSENFNITELVDNTLASGLAGGTVAKGSDTPPAPVAVGAPHACEIEYCMGNLHLVDDYAWTADDYKVSKEMMTYFANFIKTYPFYFL